MLESSLLIVGYWLLFFRYVYWITFSFQEKKIDKKVFLSYFLEGVILFSLFREFFGVKVPIPFPQGEGINFIGVLLICLGVGMCFIAHKQLGESWTHAASIKARKLVTYGMYSSIRHPIYTGLIVSYMGSQILVGSWLWVSCLFFFYSSLLSRGKGRDTS